MNDSFVIFVIGVVQGLITVAITAICGTLFKMQRRLTRVETELEMLNGHKRRDRDD